MKTTLTIAIVAFNTNLSCEAMFEIAKNDTESKIKHKENFEILMENGTLYKVFSPSSSTSGHRIDQIIIVDDCRWEIIEKHSAFLSKLEERMFYSCVPEEYLIQKYEW
jgi:hypothetical protein